MTLNGSDSGSTLCEEWGCEKEAIGKFPVSTAGGSDMYPLCGEHSPLPVSTEGGDKEVSERD